MQHIQEGESKKHFYSTEEHARLAGIGLHSDKPGHPAIMLLSHGTEGGEYLVVGVYNKVTIRKINKIGDLVTSVSVISETSPLRYDYTVSGNTEVIPYAKEWHFYTKKKSAVDDKEVNNATSKKVKPPKEHSVSRASIIDAKLALVSAKATPNYVEIIQAVIDGCNLPDSKSIRNSITSQIKIRYKWYVTGEKINPAIK